MTFIRDAADTWASLYANHAVLRSLLAFLHVGGLLAGGGAAVTTDLAALKAVRRDTGAVGAEFRRIHETHRLVVLGLFLVLASGVLLTLADLDSYLESTVFWIKMALVVGLLVNGAVLVRMSASGARGGGDSVRLRLASLASLALWFGTTLMGAVLPNAL